MIISPSNPTTTDPPVPAVQQTSTDPSRPTIAEKPPSWPPGYSHLGRASRPGGCSFHSFPEESFVRTGVVVGEVNHILVVAVVDRPESDEGREQCRCR